MSVSRLSSKTFLYSCFWYWFLPLTFFLSLSFVFKYHFDFEIAGDFIMLFSTLMIAMLTAMATVETVHRSEIVKTRRSEHLALRALSMGFITRLLNLRQTRESIKTLYQDSSWRRGHRIPISLKIQPGEEVKLSQLYFLPSQLDLSDKEKFSSPFNLIKVSGLLSRYDILRENLEIRHALAISLETKLDGEYEGGGVITYPPEQIAKHWAEMTNVINYSEQILRDIDALLVEYVDFVDKSIPAWDSFLKNTEETIYEEFGPLARLTLNGSTEDTDIKNSLYRELTGHARQTLHSPSYPVQRPQWPSYSATNVNHN